jgi:Copper type II ascorbate-dependent monooxygenase, C-terminal domain
MWFNRLVPSRQSRALAFAALLIQVLAQAGAVPTFYRDIAPILQDHCQSCHRPNEIAPMPLQSYREVRPWAKAIRQAVKQRQMPPWFAEPGIGHFLNDPSPSEQQIETISEWAESGAPAGDPHDAPPPRQWTDGWNIDAPTAVISMPKAVSIPASGDIDYTYEIVPTGFRQDTWVHMAEIRPSSRAHVHHAVVYVRPPRSKWLRDAPIGVPFTAASLQNAQDRRDAMWTDSDVLLVYAPGSSPDNWPANMAKLIPAGSDLVFQMHYVSNNKPASDCTSVGLVTSSAVPEKRVITLQLTNDRFIIPPGVDNYRVEVHGTLPQDALLLSFFPHMHLRGKRFEYNIVKPGGQVQPLLRVNYNFYWQLSYRLGTPLALKAGTELQAVAWYDNSKNNPHNPDPDSAVTWGDQTSDEMMVGFFDVAVPHAVDKWEFFRGRQQRAH